MHRTTRIAAGTIAVLALAACADGTTAPANMNGLKPNFGNGFPDNGRGLTLYKMNINAHPSAPSGDMLNDQGKRIFVKLGGNTRINLTPGPFDILDADGTDGTAAFQLPDPDPDGDGETWYGVYLRPKGKPTGGANITTCATADWDNDPATPTEELCSLEVRILVRDTGKPHVENVSRELLTLCVDTDGDLKCDERVFLFDDRAEGYLWSVDNYGLRNAEVRFLEIAQNIGLDP